MSLCQWHGDEFFGNSSEQAVVLRLRTQPNRVPSDFLVRGAPHVGAERRREQLAPQTHAEHRAARLERILDQCDFVAQIGIAIELVDRFQVRPSR